MDFIIETRGPVVFVHFPRMLSSDEQWVMLASDQHFDHPEARLDLEQKHLELARQRGAMILFFGDTFDAMQGRNDPRRTNDGLKEKYKRNDYFDCLVEDAAERYGPYADLFGGIGKGNHEQAVLEKMGTDLTQRLVDRLHQKGSKAAAMGEGGWIRFCFQISTVGRLRDLKYQHSGGGQNAPVTRGMLDTNRQAVWLGNADIVVNGHNHHNYVTAIKQERLNRSGNQEFPLTWFLRTPSYLDSFNTGQKGYKFEQGPLAQGCIWLRFVMEGKDVSISAHMDLG